MKYLILAIAVFGLMGCYKKTPDGNIPAEYIDLVKPFLGTYSGTFGETINGELEVSLEGSQPILSFRSSEGHGLFGSVCKAEIGQMIGFDGNKRKKKLNFANFKLRHNCDMEGSTLTVKVEKDGSLHLTVVARYWTVPSPVCFDRRLAIKERPRGWYNEAPVGHHIYGAQAQGSDLADYRNIPDPSFPEYSTCADIYTGVVTKK